jgi:hypothetical protein
LYDAVNDVGEMKNLAGDAGEGAVVAEMSEWLRAGERRRR